MTAASDTRLGRRLARSIALYSPDQRAIVLSYQRPRVREVAARHLVVLDQQEAKR